MVDRSSEFGAATAQPPPTTINNKLKPANQSKRIMI
ncbi:hypothetical protein HNQ40_000722 [Algisphaera agarilytica]|uniref:Uncharacterized protein n=1 Tax=Algisphaera agarilytica TaxID=1385975 RepID=A0A7X0H6C5_9BACT|nr:hypothetical protein [Algisphaera agarilytica]